MLDLNNITASINSAIADLPKEAKPKPARKPRKAKPASVFVIQDKATGQRWAGAGQPSTDDTDEDALRFPTAAAAKTAYRDAEGGAFPTKLLTVIELAAGETETDVARAAGETETAPVPTEVAVPEEILDSELVPTAQEMDTKIRATADRIDTDWTEFKDLIAQAESQKIHKELGFEIWTSYIVDVVKKNLPNVARDVDARVALVGMMTEAGMSSRDQAEALNTSQSTVVRTQTQLNQSGSVAIPEKVTTAAGKVITRADRKKPTITDYNVADKPWVAPPTALEAAVTRRQAELKAIREKLADVTGLVEKLVDEIHGRRAGIAAPTAGVRSGIVSDLLNAEEDVIHAFRQVNIVAQELGYSIPYL